MERKQRPEREIPVLDLPFTIGTDSDGHRHVVRPPDPEDAARKAREDEREAEAQAMREAILALAERLDADPTVKAKDFRAAIAPLLERKTGAPEGTPEGLSR